MVGLASGKSILSQLGNIMADNMGSADDAATGTVQNAAAKQASTCDGQLASALVKANDLISVTQKALDEELAKHKAALETIVDLQKDLAKTNTKLVEARDALGVLKDTMTESLETEKNRSKEELEALKDQTGKTLEALRDEKDDMIAMLKQELAELKDTVTKSLDTEKNRSKEELEALKDQTKKTLETLRDEKDEIIAALKEKSASTMESIKDSEAKKFQDLKTTKDEMISSLEAKLKMSSEELEATMRLELDKAKHDKEKEVAEIAANRDAIVAELTQRMEKAAEDAAGILDKTQKMVKKTQETYRKKLETTEANRDTLVATLRQSMEEAAKEADELLQTTKDEADALLSKQLETAKQQSEKWLSEKNKNIETLEEHTEKMMEKKAAIEQSLEEANKEISHWRQLHSERSYCNMTHVATDMYDVGVIAYKQTSDAAVVVYAESIRLASARVSDGLEYSNRLINGQVDVHWPKIQPYYEEHISGNYQTHLEPQLRTHVFPKLHQVSSWSHKVAKPSVLQAIENGKTSYNARVAPVLERQYQGVVRQYGNYCRSSLQEFLKASQEVEVLKDHPPPAFLMESWETSCENPRDSMSALAHGTFVLFLVIFHRRLFRFAWSIAAFAVSLVIRFTPLRFLVPRRSVTKSIEALPSSPSPPSMKEASTDSLMKAVEDDEKENCDTNEVTEAQMY